MNQLTDDILTEKPIDAASVILVRPVPKNTDQASDQALQTLLLCRGNSRTVMNNAWVFPGGKVDPTDLDPSHAIQSQLSLPATEMLNEPDLSNEYACALFAAACRETLEETGVSLEPGELQTWSRWITPNEPAMMKKRFDARFFIAALPPGQIAVHDGQEATDSQWCTPKDALRQYRENKLTLAPPQIMTLLALSLFNNVDEALESARNTAAYQIEPSVIKSDNSRILTYPGDEAHPVAIKKMPGPTRLIWKGKHFEPPHGYEEYFE